jgi:serine phosphatase RsbU (regulator of sigma subunit)
VKRSVPIRRSLIANLAWIVGLLGLTIFATTYFGRVSVARRFSQALIDQTLSRVEIELRGYFDPVAREIRLLRALGLVAGVDPAVAERLDEPIAGFMRQHPWVSSVLLARDDGTEYMLLHREDRWSRRLTRDPGGEGVVEWKEWSDSAPEPSFREERLDYDPRARPWFAGAVDRLGPPTTDEPTEIYWTEPYTFFTTREPGITASMAYRIPGGGVGVIGLDMSLIDLSRITSGIEVFGSGVAFVLSDDGRIVGIPRRRDVADDRTLSDVLLRRPEELDSRLARDAAAGLLGNAVSSGRATRFFSDREAFWGAVRRLRLSSDRELLIGVTVPEAELLDGVETQRIWIVGLTLGVLALAVARSIRLAGRYGRPVERLEQQADRMSRGDLEPGPPIETDVAEVRSLARAHERMRVGLNELLRIERDLQIARRIQQSTLPKKLPVIDGFDLAVWSEPATETGGDTYDVIGISDPDAGDGMIQHADGPVSRAVLLLADATGHGIGPALSVTQVRSMLRVATRATLELSRIATLLNRQLCADLPSGRFVTCWLADLDSKQNRLQAVSAGQGPLLWYRAASDEFVVRYADTTPLGMFDRGEIEIPPAIELGPGDVFLVASDGIFEARNAADEELGQDRVCEVIRERHEGGASDILAALRRATDRFAAGRQADDDRTVLVIKREPSPTADRPTSRASNDRSNQIRSALGERHE